MAGGRPSHFENPSELSTKVDEYFTYLLGEFQDVKKTDDEGNSYSDRVYTRYPEHPTITGLAIFLGFESRQSVYDYEKNGQYSYIIKTARLRVEHGYEKALMGDKPTGPIFALKNMGWADKMDVTSDGDKLNQIPPSVNVYNTAPPLASSESELDV